MSLKQTVLEEISEGPFNVYCFHRYDCFVDWRCENVLHGKWACIFSRLLLQAVLPTQPAPRVSSPSTSTSLRSILLASLLINNNKTARIPFCKSTSQTQRCNADGVEEADRIVSLCLPLKLLLVPRQLSEPDRREHGCPAPRPLTKSKMAAVTGIRQRGG